MSVRAGIGGDRKSTRLNSSHGYISYAVFCLKKKKQAHSRSEDVRNLHDRARLRRRLRHDGRVQAFFFNDTATTEIYTLSLHDALPISCGPALAGLSLTMPLKRAVLPLLDEIEPLARE